MIRRPATILALLTGLNFLNYLDRLVLSAVLKPIQRDLDMTNLLAGLLATVFLLGYFFTAPVFGALGDRLPRKGLIAFGILVWSGATLASGMCTSAVGLLVARAFVGIGEASYAVLAPTIIDDLYPPERKGRILSIFYLATPLGAALGFIVGGFVGAHWGWRHAFFVAGGPGILLALVCLFIKEPERTLTEKPDVWGNLAKLVRIPLYRKGVLGYCAVTAAIGGFQHWAPTFLDTRYNLGLDGANFRFGLVVVVGGAAGTVIGGRWSDKSKAALGNADENWRIKSLLKICAVGATAGAPFALFAFLSPSSTLFFTFAFLCILFLFLNTSPINAVALGSVPPELRASAMALQIFAIHLLGDLWSPPFVGLLADHMPMQIALLALPVCIAAGALLWWPVKNVRKMTA